MELYERDDLNCDQRMTILFRILAYTHPKIKELDLSQTTDENGEQQKPVTVNLQDLVKIARGDTVG
jgi:hypothetical protein